MSNTSENSSALGPVIILNENFNDGILNTDGWTYASTSPGQSGSYVAEHNGYLDIQQASTDNGGRAIYELDAPASDVFVTFDQFYHNQPSSTYYGNSNFYDPSVRFDFVNELGELSFVNFHLRNNEYLPTNQDNPDYVNHPKVTFGSAEDYNIVFDTNIVSSSLYDQWLSMEFSFNSTEGTVEIDYAPAAGAEISIGSDSLVGMDLTSISFHSYGWWTGHYTYIDNLLIVGDSSPSDEVLYSENFEDSPVGVLPGGFEVVYSGLGQAYQDVAQSDEGNRFLDIQAQAGFAAVIRNEVNIDLPDVYTVEVDIRLEHPGTFSSSYTDQFLGDFSVLGKLKFKEEGGTGATSVEIGFFELDDGTVMVSMGPSGERITYEVAYDDWFSVSFIIDEVNSTQTLTINGQVVGVMETGSYDASAAWSGQSAAAGFVFQSENHGVITTQYDNIRILGMTAEGEENQAPTSSLIDLDASVVGESVNIAINERFDDPDGDNAAMTFDVSGLPDGVEYSSGFLTGAPTVAGDFTVSVVATDEDGASVTDDFTWTVESKPEPEFDHATTNELFAARGGKVAFLADLSLAAYHLDLENGHEIQADRVNDYKQPGEDAYDNLPDGLELLDAGDLPGLEFSNGFADNFPQDGIDNGIYTEENSAALVARSENAVFVAFRGTNDLDGSALFDGELSTPDQRDWLPGTMDDHFDNYDRLFYTIGAYLEQHPEIKILYLTGHSLGGGMVEAAMRDGVLDFPSVTISAVTFASPGYPGSPADSLEFLQSNYRIFGDVVPWANLSRNDTSGDINDIQHNFKVLKQGVGNQYWDYQEETTASVVDGEVQDIATMSASDLHSMQLYSDFVSFFESQEIYSTYQNGKDYDTIIAHGTVNNIKDQDYDIGSAADKIFGGSGAEIILGGARADLIKGGRGDDYIKGGSYSDTIKGGWGHDYIDAGTGHDTVQGGLKKDEIYGDTGNDTLSGDQGLDTIYGGDGHDDIFGGTDADHLYGNANNDDIEGGNGSDVIKGGDGYDVIYGEDGSDTIYGNKDNDIIFGGKRADDLFGNKGKDTIYGDGGNDVIEGDEKSDWLYGGNDEDSILGGTGSDTIEGGKGADRIHGNEDNDTITGNQKGDKIWGGIGKDTFIFTSVKDSTVEKENAGADRIYDFGKGGKRDVFDVSEIDAKWGAISNFGNQKFSFIDDDNFSNTKGELRTEIKGNNTIIEADTNGDGDADLTILLKGAHVLVESDFIL